MIKIRKNRNGFKVTTVKRGLEFHLFGWFWWFQKGLTEQEARNKGYEINWVSGTGYEYTPYRNKGLWYGCSDN